MDLRSELRKSARRTGAFFLGEGMRRVDEMDVMDCMDGMDMTKRVQESRGHGC
jgi:hypothetical protein